MSSILTDVKKMLSIPEDYEQFDADIIIHINSVFSILAQLGVGSKSGFAISDKTTEWSDYIGEDYRLNDVKTYIYLKVRLIFDAPTSTAAVEAMKEAIKEIEFRLNVTSHEIEEEEEDDDA